MEFNASRLANPAILHLQPYPVGNPISEMQKKLGLKRISKLAYNENPLGTSRLVTEGLKKEMGRLCRYPDDSANSFKQALSKHLKVMPEQIIVGNGSEEVLRMLMQAFAWSEGHIILPQYSFVAYKVIAQGFGIKTVEIPSPEYKVNVEGIVNAITSETRMIILANPNNPTGTYINKEEFDYLISRIPEDIVLVCDEAYYEYVKKEDYPQTLSLLTHYSNLIVTRTFSKAYGLAGIRLGYGVAHPQLIELINRIRQPFNLNHLAMMAGCLALQDQAFVMKSLKVNQEGKKQLYQGLRKLGFKYMLSEGNFIMVEVPGTSAHYHQSLLQEGVLVRSLEPFQLSNRIRVTIGLKSENEHFLEAMQTIS